MILEHSISIEIDDEEELVIDTLSLWDGRINLFKHELVIRRSDTDCLTLKNVPPSLKGDLTKWILKKVPQGFIGNINRVREKGYGTVLGERWKSDYN